MNEFDYYIPGTLFLNANKQLCIIVFRNHEYIQAYNPAHRFLSFKGGYTVWKASIQFYTIIAKAESQ